MPYVYCVDNYRYRRRTISSDILRENNASLFKLPECEEMKRKWLSLCRKTYNPRSDIPNNLRVCSTHFSPDSYERNLMYELMDKPLPKNLRRLKPEAIQTLHLPTVKGMKK